MIFFAAQIQTRMAQRFNEFNVSLNINRDLLDKTLIHLRWEKLQIIGSQRQLGQGRLAKKILEDNHDLLSLSGRQTRLIAYS